MQHSTCNMKPRLSSSTCIIPHTGPQVLGILPFSSQNCSKDLFQLLGETNESLHQLLSSAPRAENAKINVTDEPYFDTYIVCSYRPFSKAAKGAQGGPQQ